MIVGRRPESVAIPALPGEVERRRLANGLEVCLLRNRQAPIVSTALFYRAGCRDEAPGRAGVAHFLEHMMFKGSARYGPGEVDRRTQELGGTNNAFTSHDVTAYWFAFAADRWSEALAIEADRMRGLRLDPREVDAERQVILEEIDMYRDDPWEALELDVVAALFAGHPYGRPILGTADELRASGRDELADFHRRSYRADNAVLVVAGDLDETAAARVEEALGGLPAGDGERRAECPPPRCPERPTRVERRQGEVARLLVALPAPAADEPDHAELQLAAALLAEGRSSRLQRELVEVGQLCLGISATVSEHEIAAYFGVAAELLPSTDPGDVERRLLAALSELGTPAGEDELERARQVLRTDWVHEHERIHQQAVAAGVALTQFDLEQPGRVLRRVEEASAEEVAAAARRWLDPEGGIVVGACLPEGRRQSVA
ncbi:MAG TPA: pitrilysin family protein [Thermoanaerobaculia bacterium]|jgi:zinc protease